MTIQEILDGFNYEKAIGPETIKALQEESELRKQLINHFRQKKDREFALALLNKFINIRASSSDAELSEGAMSMEDLMLACYILGLHNQVADVLKIWEAKYVDFDTYCGVDIQLTVFAGVAETISFLRQQATAEALKALEYITKCADCGDFDSITEYFSPTQYPWFV